MRTAAINLAECDLLLLDIYIYIGVYIYIYINVYIYIYIHNMGMENNEKHDELSLAECSY